MSIGDSEDAQKKAAFAKPKWAASPAPIIEEEAGEESESEKNSGRGNSVGSLDDYQNQQMLRAYNGEANDEYGW